MEIVENLLKLPSSVYFEGVTFFLSIEKVEFYSDKEIKFYQDLKFYKEIKLEETPQEYRDKIETNFWYLIWGVGGLFTEYVILFVFYLIYSLIMTILKEKYTKNIIFIIDGILSFVFLNYILINKIL